APVHAVSTQTVEAPPAPAETPPAPASAPPSLDLEQLQEAWQRTVVTAVEQRSMPTAAVLRLAHPALLAGETLTVEFPPSASFHLSLDEDPKATTMLQDALYEVTGRRLRLDFAIGEAEIGGDEPDRPTSESEFYELLKETFDAREENQ
ncbi:MAG: hypothetical protein ACR2MU_05730, partial [Gaiellaceae bacterium]